MKLASRQTLETKNLPRKLSNKKVTEEIHAENLNFKNTRSRGVHGSNASFDQAPPHRDLPRKREESRKIKEGKTEKITTMEEEIGAAPPPLGEREGDRGHTSPGNTKTYIPRPSIQTAGNTPERMFGNNGEGNKVDAGRNMDGQRRPFSAVAVPANGTTIRDEDLTKAFASIDPTTREEIIQKFISLARDGQENQAEAGGKRDGQGMLPRQIAPNWQDARGEQYFTSKRGEKIWRPPWTREERLAKGLPVYTRAERLEKGWEVETEKQREERRRERWEKESHIRMHHKMQEKEPGGKMKGEPSNTDNGKNANPGEAKSCTLTRVAWQQEQRE